MFNIRKYLWLVILLTTALGFVWPAPGVLIQPYLVYILIVMMTLSCLNINLLDFKKAPKMWWRYVLLLTFIYIIPAMIIFLFKGLIDKQIFVGLIVAAAVPSAISVVALSQILGGDVSKALIATFFAHIVSPFLTPLVIWLFAGQIVKVDFLSIFILIVKLVLLPFVLARLIKFLKWEKFISRQTSFVNTILLIFIILGIIAPAKNLVAANLTAVLIASAIVLLILILEVVVSIWFGRTKKEDITWVVVDTYKNFTLSSVIALQIFGPMAVLGSVVFSIMDNLIIVPIQWWANGAKKRSILNKK